MSLLSISGQQTIFLNNKQMTQITFATPGGVFFQAGVLFNIGNAKFWPILTNFGYLSRVCALFGVLFTRLDNMAVYQN